MENELAVNRNERKGMVRNMKRSVRRRFLFAVCMVLMACTMFACGKKEVGNKATTTTEATTKETVAEGTTTLEEESTSETETTTETETLTEVASTTEMETTVEETTTEVETTVEVTTQAPTEAATEEATTAVSGHVSDDGKTLIVIDAGHQGKGNYEKEPIGPGASEMKAKVASGTAGCVTKIPEYEITLILAQKLEQELKARGYEVIMVRTTHDVNISNSERAEIANQANADAFIRIHCNGSEDSSVHGAMTLCQTPTNPYNGALYAESRRLSENVLDELVAVAGCKKRSIWETDTMSGINWCQVPVTIVEVGYMSNPDEDRLIVTEEYQNKLVLGMANGIDKTFK